MKLIRALLLPALLLLAIAVGSDAASAQTIVHTSCGGLGSTFPASARGVPFSIDENGNTCINGSITASLAGFTPNGNYAVLTSAGTSGSVALPAGATVLFQNTGTTQVSCTLGVGSATALVNQIQVPASSTVPVVVGSNTFGACIDQSGSVSNVVVLAGGSGLGNGFGGGGGGAGGSSAITTWAGGTLGAMANYGTTPGAVLVPGFNAFVTNTVAVSGTVTTTPPSNASTNLAQVNGVTALVGNGVSGTGSLRVNVASDNTPFPVKIDQTTPGTTNAFALSTLGANAIATGNGIAGTGVLRVAVASDNTAFAVNAASTLAAETTKVIGTVRTLGNAGAILDFAGSAVTSPANSYQVGGQFLTVAPALTNGQSAPFQLDANSNLLINCKAGCSSASDTTINLSGMTASNAATQIALVGTNSTSVLLSGTWVGTITPEVSTDGGSTWVATRFWNVNTQTVATTVTTNGTYDILGTGGKSHARVRLSAYTSGTVTGNLRAVAQAPSANDAEATAAVLASTPLAACSASPCVTTVGNTGALAIAQNVERAAGSNATQVGLAADLVGKLINLPYANPENTLNGQISTAMTATTSTAVTGMGAQGAGVRNYVTACTFSNTHATVGTMINLQDGSGGTVLWQAPAGPAFNGAAVVFPTPIKTTANTALFAVNVTTGASTFVSCTGYKGV